jgi:hypothetical protein
VGDYRFTMILLQFKFTMTIWYCEPLKQMIYLPN